jgi:3'(2'), 5'-bisphosphate nucleotidase
MPSNTYSSLLLIAAEAASAAGHKIMEVYNSGQFGTTFKDDKSPLTLADTLAHDIICQMLAGTGIPVLSEEGRSIPYHQRSAWKQLWVVDPIDGTKEFIKRNGEFTVNIALVENCFPVLGVIYAPAIGQLYAGAAGAGAVKCAIGAGCADVAGALRMGAALPIDQPMRPLTVAGSTSHMSPETLLYIESLKKDGAEINVISKGSSLKLCMVAEGTADIYPRFGPTMEWDTAAGDAILSAAGGQITDYVTRKKMEYNRPDLLNSWFVARRDKNGI